MTETCLISELKHTPQRYSWDCGLACACMIFRFLGKTCDGVYGNDLESLGCKESIWTIDLAHLLAIKRISHKLCTISTSVDKKYSTKCYYAKNFNHEEARVNSLFDQATSYGIVVEKRHVDVTEIHRHVTLGHVLISLVDDTHMRCNWCDAGMTSMLSMLRRVSCLKNAYVGHFIVVCGVNLSEQLVYYKNPAKTAELCCMDVANFDEARMSHGTDEDLLFVYGEQMPS